MALFGSPEQARAAMLNVARERDRQNDTFMVANICVQILAHRSEISQSAKGDAIVQQADRTLLSFMNGLTEETKE